MNYIIHLILKGVFGGNIVLKVNTLHTYMYVYIIIFKKFQGSVLPHSGSVHDYTYKYKYNKIIVSPW